MFTFEMVCRPYQIGEDFEQALWDLLHAWAGNGQVLEQYQNTVQIEDRYECRFVCPEEGALEEQYDNVYVAARKKELYARCTMPPTILCVGENCDVTYSCDCENPSHYVLQTNALSFESPLLCGDCKSPVPLYKLPKTYQETEYYDVLRWMKQYQACDRLFLENLEESAAYHQMHSPSSALARFGQEVCRKLQKDIGRPVYYALFQFGKENGLACPSCGRPWHNHDIEEIQYPYVCPSCRLVSETSGYDQD